MKTLTTLSLAAATLFTLSSCCGTGVSKRLPGLPDAPVAAPTPQMAPAPVSITPTK